MDPWIAKIWGQFEENISLRNNYLKLVVNSKYIRDLYHFVLRNCDKHCSTITEHRENDLRDHGGSPAFAKANLVGPSQLCIGLHVCKYQASWPSITARGLWSQRRGQLAQDINWKSNFSQLQYFKRGTQNSSEISCMQIDYATLPNLTF